MTAVASVASTNLPVEIVSLTDGLDRYRRSVSILKKGYEQEKYRVVQILRSSMANKMVHEITSVDIAKYREDRLASVNQKTGKFISAATVRLEMSLLSNFFDIARIEWGYTHPDANNPCRNVRKPKLPPGRDRRLTTREERQILRYAYGHSNPEFYPILIVALHTAMRQGEILGLRWEHINLRTRIAHLPDTKNGTKRDVPLKVTVVDALRRLGVKTHGPVFGYTASGLKSTWCYMREHLKIVDLHFHDLRHEAISKMFELGTLDMLEISEISGHKSLSMLKRYTHLRASRLLHKMEGTRSKARMAVIRELLPYPSVVSLTDSGVDLVFPDFEQERISISALNVEEAITAAQNLLMRTILTYIREGKKLPRPVSGHL